MPKRRALVAVLVTGIILSFLMPALMPTPVYATTTTFYGHVDDAFISKSGSSYSSVRTATTGGVTSDHNDLYIGQYYDTGEYLIYRSVVYYDTSSIPDTAVVTSAKLKLYVDVDFSDTDFYITIQNGMPTYPHKPATSGDYNQANYSGNGGQLSTSSITEETYADITLSSTGLTWINLTGWTKFMLRSSRDINGNTPTGEERVAVYSHNHYVTYGDKPPVLEITYTCPPSVTTGTATDILDTEATLGGAITDTGGAAVTTRGFKYGLTQTPTWDVHETGTFGTGAYTLDITGLSAGTMYWFEAYAVNTAGTSYGSWVSFTTMDVPSITTEDASNVAGTSARLNSALASDGGGGCTIKFGWGLSSESAIEDYDNYETLPGTYTTGQYPYLDVAGLISGQTYYFRVSATNEIGTDTGDELTFETPIILSAPANFIGYPEPTSISLSWSKGTGSTNTLVRYGTTDYPNTVTAGTYAYSGPSSTYTVEDLVSGKTYYFSAWGESGGNYSATYTTLLMTTSASSGGTTPDMDVPTQPSRWFSAPDYTSMAGLGVLYDSLNSAMDSGSIPRETGWFLGAVGLATLLGLIAYLKLGKKLLIGMIVLTVGLAAGYFVKLIPWWVPLMTLILVIAFSMTHKQVSEG